MKIVGLSFDHMHMNDLLRQAHEHPEVEIVGVADSNPQNAVNVARCAREFEIPAERVFDDYARCLEATRPNIAILCPAIAAHADLTELAARAGAHVLVEKPFAISLAHADRMIEACAQAKKRLAINWPIAWYREYATTHRLIEEGTIGEVTEVHYYGGNAGPLGALADANEVDEQESVRAKNASWFYQEAAGGGSLIDYIGYGTTLGTWFHGGRAPLDVTCSWHIPAGLEVDEHSLAIARYATGLSKFETRWGTFTNPWTHQPQPKCGFTIVGTEGTLAAYNYESTIQLQTREKPQGFEVFVDELRAPNRNAIEHFVDAIQNDTPLIGPLDPAICRVGQRIVDAAIQSASEKRTVVLPA